MFGLLNLRELGLKTLKKSLIFMFKIVWESWALHDVILLLVLVQKVAIASAVCQAAPFFFLL